MHNFFMFFLLQQEPKHIEMKIIKKKGCTTQMVHKNYQLLQVFTDHLHSAEKSTEKGLWEKHRVVSSVTLTGQSAISLHPSDYVHAKQNCT